MILVATPEPTSLTDAYSLLKVLSKHPGLPRIKVVINHVKTAVAAKRAYARLKETVHKFLPIQISPLGIVAQDHNVPISVISQIPFFMLFPDTDASRCIRSIALKLAEDPLGKADMPMELFWDKCLGFLAPQNQTGSRPGEQKRAAGQTPGREKTLVSGRDNPADLEERMAVIEDKISLLLEGMNEIKALLTANDFKTSQIDKSDETAPRSANTQLPAPELISLDFESWVKEQSVRG